jgi:hypothetical protein
MLGEMVKEGSCCGTSVCVMFHRKVAEVAKRQTRPLVREGARIGEDRNCQTVNNHLVMSPTRGSTPRHTDRPTVGRIVTGTLTLTELARNWHQSGRAAMHICWCLPVRSQIQDIQVLSVVLYGCETWSVT